MSKQYKDTRAVVQGHRGEIVQQVTLDDSLLPSAEELEKLKLVNPELISWIMRQTEKEQDTRLHFNTEQMRLAHREQGTRQGSMWLAFVISVLLLCLSGVFIFLEKELAGTVFGGVGVIFIVQGFLKFGQPSKK